MIFDTDGISIPPFSWSGVDLDDRVDLRVEPLDEDLIATMSIRDRDDTTLTSIGSELSEMSRMDISELDQLLDGVFYRLLSVSLDLVERVSSQISYISTRLEEWWWYDKNPNRSLMHHPKFCEIREYVYWSAEYRFCKLSQYTDICVWVSDDDLFASLEKETLRYEESGSCTTGMGISSEQLKDKI